MNQKPNLLQTLPNPLYGTVVGDPWTSRETDPDVREIHRDVFELCCQAVEEARTSGHSRGIVIHGQAGSGKTHLIGRLRRRLTDNGHHHQLDRLSQAFAYVKLNTNAGSLVRHVRRCVAGDLLRKQRGDWSQFERMVISRLMEVADGDGDMTGWWEYFLEVRAKQDLDGLLQHLQASENLSPGFVKVLASLIRREHRLDVASWLRGDPLSEAALQRLDLGEEHDEEDPELLSQRTLLDFMRLAGEKVPLVLCFDQIEALQSSPEDRESYFSFGKLVKELADADPNLVLISCLQTSRLAMLEEVIPGFAMAQIRSRATMTLNPLTIEQAGPLLAQRLAPLAKSRPIGASEIWPFTHSDLETMVGPLGCSPRELIEKAAVRFEVLRNAAISGIPTSPPAPLDEWLQTEWERREDLAEQTNTTEATAEVLMDGIPRLLSVVAPEWKSSSPSKGLAVDYILTAPQKEAKVGIKICEGSTISLAARLKTLSTLHPAKTGLQKLVLLRDERTPISKNSIKTLEYLATLEKNDAIYLPVAPQTLTALDALRRVLADAASGDLARGAETISTDQVLEWLRAHLPDALKELADALVTPSGSEVGHPPAHPFLPPLQEWLTSRCLARWSEALESIEVSGKQADELLSAVEQRTDLFGVIRGEPTVIFSSKLASPSLVAARNES